MLTCVPSCFLISCINVREKYCIDWYRLASGFQDAFGSLVSDSRRLGGKLMLETILCSCVSSFWKRFWCFTDYLHLLLVSRTFPVNARGSGSEIIVFVVLGEFESRLRNGERDSCVHLTAVSWTSVYHACWTSNINSEFLCSIGDSILNISESRLLSGDR